MIVLARCSIVPSVAASKSGTGKIDAAAFGTEVERQRLPASDRDAGRRQKMLAAVLLHVVAPAFGVDRSLHVFVGGRTLQAMQDAIVVGLGTSRTGSPPSVPVSCGWPPDVG
jgi:hypothetical protein